ncbi:hypothetical protein SKAU_G00214090 [Synaphobranchus kaupii]|uniref:Uncharacterized protein n=1 Tax=Synaphobranchus kaupii TaxID=118154 RepID=A0A9Q1F9R2_SYNKA|nr:hypothetical protein SKAU_G00214090 [Synaphobranchus kaupii]
MKAATRARVQKHREKLYSNPELLEEYRRKERERYLKRKESGLLKSAKDMNAKQRKKQKKVEGEFQLV